MKPSILYLFIFFNIWGIYLQAQEPVKEFSPTIEDYEKFMTKMEDMTKNLTTLDSWEKISFKHKVTGKIIEWKNLSDYEKTMFCLVMAERTTDYLTKMDMYWQQELKIFDKPNHKLIPMSNPKNDKQKPAKKEDVKIYVYELLALRKKFALEYENFAKKSLKTYEKEIPQPEREKILKSIFDYHDKYKLVERK